MGGGDADFASDTLRVMGVAVSRSAAQNTGEGGDTDAWIREATETETATVVVSGTTALGLSSARIAEWYSGCAVQEGNMWDSSAWGSCDEES
jgi:hypothetical protein